MPEHQKEVRQQEDVLPVKTLVIITVSFLVLAFASFLFTWLEQWAVSRSSSVSVPATGTGRIEQGLFGPVKGSPGLRPSKERAAPDRRHDLEAYAWIDREQGRIAIPIEEAMGIVASRKEARR